MSNRLKNHIYCLFSYVFGLVISWISLGLVRTVCNQFWEGPQAIQATRYFQHLLILPIVFIMIYRYKKKESDEAKEYKAKMQGRLYSTGQDVKELLASVDFWGEVIFISVVTLLYTAIYVLTYGQGAWIFWNIPVYILYELVAYLFLHRVWLKKS